MDGRISDLFAVRARLLVRRKNLQCLHELLRLGGAALLLSLIQPTAGYQLLYSGYLITSLALLWTGMRSAGHSDPDNFTSLHPRADPEEACNQSPCRGILISNSALKALDSASVKLVPSSRLEMMNTILP